MTTIELHTPETCRTTPLEVRTLRSAEADTVQIVFDGLSARSRLRRFHTGLSELSPRMLHRLSDVSPGHHVAPVGLRHGRPVGIVRWVRYPGQHPSGEVLADLAAEVVDLEQGRGVGRLLVTEAMRSASHAGITMFSVFVSDDNRWLRRRLLDLGAIRRSGDEGELWLPVKHPLKLWR
ncbi:MAG: GNAT family N-acetyltransferase [Terracoccus sp.]